MERVRAMLLDAKLDKELWAEAAVTANYIKNRSPSSSSTQTPWELFYGRKPDVSNMRVFGARAYVHAGQSALRRERPYLGRLSVGMSKLGLVLLALTSASQ